MPFIIDRFEGDYAIVETDTKTFVHLPAVLLPSDAKEGDCIEIHITATDRKEKIENLMNSLFED